MKIAFLIQDCTTVGGTERVTCLLANQMAGCGHEVSVISVFATGGECKFPLDSRVRFVVACGMDYSLRMSRLRRLMLLAQMAHRLKRNELLIKADVVIAQKFFAALMGVYAGFSPKLIVGEHYHYRLYGQPWLKLRDMVYCRAKAVVVLTEGCRRDFVRNGVNNVEVVGNMLPVSTVHSKEECENVILAVGRLSREKGFDSLIEAVSRIKERIIGWRVEICGEGDERERLTEMIERYGLNDVVLLRGRIEDIAAEYARASFVVVPSRYEGFSLVLLEAAAMQRPAVSFDCPYGPREILAEGGGLLVEDQNIDALADAIVRMIGDAELREQCSEQTRKIVERFSPEKIYNQWMLIIEKYL